MLRYWQGAWQRGITPLDVAADLSRWWDETCEPARARVGDAESRGARVARSPGCVTSAAPAQPDVVPTLLVPPQAGHASCIVDYSAEQSQVKTARAAGLTRLYALDWVGATQETKDAGDRGLPAFMDRAIDQIGGPVNLIGDCQGGWLATIYAALHPEPVQTLTIAGAPIDFHAGER